MGTASSKFKKYLQHGDEFAAMQVYQSSGDLKRHLDPNISYGENHNHNTPLHYAAKHGMKHLLRTFLHDLGGNPNKRNAFNETVLHAACNLEPSKWFSAQERRAACVSLILQWRDVDLSNGTRERVDLQAQDQKGDTALHCAAGSGLKRCVELLLSHGSPLFVENHEHLTPCDVAVRSQHHDIAALLESRMVFADSNDTVNEAELNGGSEQDEVYSGLRTQDLQEAKDQLLVETSDMLHIPLFTAEALLRDNEWSRETLLDKWMKDPVQCCHSAGVQPPPMASETGSGSFFLTRPLCSRSVVEESNSCDEQETEGETGPKSDKRGSQVTAEQMAVQKDEEFECTICMQSVGSWAMLPRGTMSCGHTFCSTCWESYLTLKIQDGDAHHISCPEYNCDILVPVEVIEKSVTPEVARRYLQFDIKAFVESSRCIKWCPRPGCGQAVRLPETEQTPPPSAAPTSHAVDCGNGHFFCWECLGEVHAPSGCEQWQQWQRKIGEVKPEELPTEGVDIEDAANCLWLVTNSKPCPNCKSPIQKNEGCNHMKCSKCKLDFCWVCLESWKKHSSSTGGYFRCNRFEAVNKADERQGVLISEAMMRNQQATELSRFLHYYTRFRNHENSQKLEEPLLSSAPTKMALLAACLTPNRSPGEDCKIEKGTQFVVSGVRELLKARRILCGSYVYGYYLQDNGYNKSIFEFMQNELEEVTEKLSEQIARPYLRTPRSLIIQTTALVRRKRHEFVRAVNKGLVPPETPPVMRKNRKRRFPGIAPELLDDKELSQAIEASLKEMDQNSLWAKDSVHLHGVPPADYDSDEELPCSANAPLTLCARFGCVRPCAHNTRTQNYHQFCSLRCSRTSKIASTSGDAYNLDLVIALEMSRLQMLEDELKRHQQKASAQVPSFPESTNSPDIATRPPAPLPHEIEKSGTMENSGARPRQDSLDEPTKLAIRLSLQDSDRPEPPQEAGDQIESSTHIETLDNNLNSSSQNLNSGPMDMNLLIANCSAYRKRDNNESIYQGTSWAKPLPGSSLVGEFKHVPGEDGRFEISDIHENGIFNDEAIRCANGDNEFDNYNHFEVDDTVDVMSLKRSHSTGDLIPRRGWRLRRGEPRYHLDSDHSSQHDDKPEEIARRILKAERHTLLLAGLHGSGGSTAGSTADSTAGSTADDTGVDYGQQSSLDEASVVCDSINADLEVCGILNNCKPSRKSGDVRSIRSFANLAAIGKKPALDLDFIDEYGIDAAQKLCAVSDPSRDGNKPVESKEERDWKSTSSPIPSASIPSDFTGLSSVSISHTTHCKPSSGKISSGQSSLRIRISKSPQLVPSPLPCKPLQETDSSNEYESETGIPKSPTLFISGVSISRTPEPRSPALSVSAAGRQSRSSSLTVPVAPSPPSSIEAELSPNLSPTLCLSGAATAPNSPRAHSGTPSPVLSPRPSNNQQQPSTKSKSASEPERDREMFRFPKSSTDGALSSVLHVQESNLSSDDFHEALFLLERSKAVGSNVVTKKRKKSKKERDKDKENSTSTSGKPLDIIEASSAL